MYLIFCTYTKCHLGYMYGVGVPVLCFYHQLRSYGDGTSDRNERGDGMYLIFCTYTKCHLGYMYGVGVPVLCFYHQLRSYGDGT